MKVEILFLITLLFVAYLGAGDLSAVSAFLLSSNSLSAVGLTRATLPIAVAALSFVIWIAGLTVRHKNRNVARGLGILAALIAGHAARLAWLLNSGAHVGVLWGMAIAIAITSALITRDKSSDAFGDSSTLSPRMPLEDYSLSRVGWAFFILIAAGSAAFFSYRLYEVPGELNSFGSQAISSANRLLHGEVAIRDLILYREMTQEEAGSSILFVLPHALSQLLSGGPSLVAARVVCAVASWLSVLMMFRVGRHVGGVAFGLVSMAIFAAIPVTFHNARTEAIFGFSGLLILTVCDLFLIFLRKPSVGRAVLAGIAAPLVGYGVANIKFLFLALLITVVFVILRRGQVRGYLRHGVVAAGCAFLILIPQLLNISEVRLRMRGRGEHVFGGVLPHLATLDPAKPTPLQKALEILGENSRFLMKEIFGPWVDASVSLPGTLAVPMIIGLCLILSAPLIPSRLFAGLVWLGAYVAPFISIPIGPTRILMLNIGQTLVMSVVWVELLHMIRSIRLQKIGLVLWFVALAVSLSSASGPARALLSGNSDIVQARNVITRQPVGTVVFFTDRHESSGNFLRWTPPFIGRDSSFERPLVGIRENAVPTIVSLVERLSIPAIVVSNEPPPSEIASLPAWRYERIPPSLWSMTYVPPSGASPPVVQVLEPTKLGPTNPVILENVNYSSPRLFLTRLSPGSSLNLELRNDMDLEGVAILARGRNSHAASVTVTVDDGAIPAEAMGYATGGGSSTWLYLPQLSSGVHRVTMQPTSEGASGATFVDDVVVIGVPRAK
jgi:hypothetical protein